MELEKLLIGHSDIADAAVIGVPHPTSGEVPCAYVVLKESSSTVEDPNTISTQEIADYMEGKVAHFKQLRGGVRIVSEIPKSGSGKVLKRVLKEMEERREEEN